MNIINKIKEFFNPKTGVNTQVNTSYEVKKCFLCKVNLLGSNKDDFEKHYNKCLINFNNIILQIPHDYFLMDILNILNKPIEYPLSYDYTAFSKPIFTAEELYIIFKKNEVLCDFRKLPAIGIIGTFWYVMDFIKFKGNSTHELIKMPLFDKIFFDQGLITTKHVFDSTQYSLTDKGLKLKELLLEQPKITSRFFSELKEPNRQIYTDFYNFLARHPEIFEEEINVLNGMRF